MSSRKDFRLVVDTYNFFYKTINRKENSVLKMFPSRIKAIENFIEKFKNEFSVNFLQKDILDQMEFTPIISEQLKEMDSRIFLPKPMGIKK